MSTQVGKSVMMHRRLAVMVALGCAAAAGVAFVGPSRSARAQEVGPVEKADIAGLFKVNDADPEGSIPSLELANKHPLDMGYFIMSATDKAIAAVERRDYIAAAKYYRAVAKATPDHALGFARACAAYDAAGDLERAVANCRFALGRTGVTIEDNLRFVAIVMKKKGALLKDDIEDVEAVAAHLRTQVPTDKKTPAKIECELAVRLGDPARLEACTKQWATIDPSDPKAYAFTWALAMQKQDAYGAYQLVQRAKKANLATDVIAPMESGLRARFDRWTLLFVQFRSLGPARIGVALATLAVAAAALAFLLRRKSRERVLRSA